MIFDNDQNKNVALECKEFVRYLQSATKLLRHFPKKRYFELP